ncbi:MAG: hypothetical protein AAF378_21715 [Cyanobacteria bacterium P01_A01_bin.84]
MQLRSFVVIFICFTLVLLSWIFSPNALAMTQIKLSELTYNECPPEIGQGQVTSNGAANDANCFMVTGKAFNPTNKLVYDADIFGRIYDANNNPILANRTRLGLIREVPPGESDFKLRITVPATQPTPLKLKQFKASGFASASRWRQ